MENSGDGRPGTGGVCQVWGGFPAKPQKQWLREVVAVKRLGARRPGDPAVLVQAVRTVSQGRKYITPEIAQLLAENIGKDQETEAPHEKLSDRELQTLVMIASGKRLSDIATELTLSPKTVSVYRARVLEKLALANNSELTVYAIRNGLVGE